MPRIQRSFQRSSRNERLIRAINRHYKLRSDVADALKMVVVSVAFALFMIACAAMMLICSP